MKIFLPFPWAAAGLLILFIGLFIVRLFTKRFRTRWEWFFFVSGSVMGYLLFFLAAPWVFLSVYLRWVFLPFYVWGLIFSFRRVPVKRSKRKSTTPYFIVKRVAFIVLFGAGLFLYFDSKTFHDKPVALDFPLHRGPYYVMQGGSNFLSNPFHSSYVGSYGYAMDICRLNDWGNRANTIYSKNVADYAIYNDTVYAPCAGTVVFEENKVPDNIPGTLNLEKMYGNYILLQGDGFRVYIGHLRPGSVRVKKGDHVNSGQPLARQGNAGLSIEPHLHLNAVRDYAEDDVYGGRSVPITFKGKFYTVNDVIP